MSENTQVSEIDRLEVVNRLSRDVRAAGRTLSRDEARFLVDAYYQMQRNRIRAGNQTLALSREGEPHAVVQWLRDQDAILERQLVGALARYAEGQIVGRWSQTILGIGPILSAGLLAHIDITRAPTVGHIWRFAGLDPTVTWAPKTKRPWNANLKTLCWKIGESFVKVSNHKDDVYGHLWAERKALEMGRNEDGAFAAQAAAALAAKRYRDDTIAKRNYEAGRLPPGHLHARAKRWAVKLFLAHWHHVAHCVAYGTPPPKPYVLSILGHGHEIPVPHWPME